MKEKAFFITFKKLSIKQITQFFLEGDRPSDFNKKTLVLNILEIYVNFHNTGKIFDQTWCTT